MKAILILFALTGTLVLHAQESAFDKGVKAYQEENYPEALKQFREVIVAEPGHARAHYYAGRACLDMSRYKEAADFLSRAIGLDSSRSNWLYELALVYTAIPDYQKALQCMLDAEARGQVRTSDFIENLGIIYVQLKEYERGAELFREVLAKKPYDRELWFQTAQAFYRAGKYQQAIDHWDEALALDKDDAESLYMIGLSYQKLGEKKKGQQLCDKAIEMNPALKSKRQQIGEAF